MADRLTTDPTPAEARAEMRRMLDVWHRGVDPGLIDYLTRHSDVLLADPEPRITDEQRAWVQMVRQDLARMPEPAVPTVEGALRHHLLKALDLLTEEDDRG